MDGNGHASTVDIWAHCSEQTLLCAGLPELRKNVWNFKEYFVSLVILV